MFMRRVRSELRLSTLQFGTAQNLAVSGTSENRAWNEGKSKWLSSDLQKNVSREDRAPALRKTKIVGTVGPSSWSRDTLFPLLDFGMNVVRLNMSHGDHASHKAVVDLVKEYNASGRRTDKVRFRWISGSSFRCCGCMSPSSNANTASPSEVRV